MASITRGIRIRQRRRRIRLTPEEAAGMRALKDQRFRISLPYYSKVAIQWVRSGVGPYTYTMAATEVAAFSYAVGDGSLTAAGFPAGSVAHWADTNLQSKYETNSGEEVHIRGIGCIVWPGNDARLTALTLGNTAVFLTFNGGRDRIPLGPPVLTPGGVGLFGVGPDALGTQPIAGGRPMYGEVTNGYPHRANVMKLPEGMIWRNKGDRDSQFSILLQPRTANAVTYTTQIADEVAAAGIRGYSYPGSTSVTQYFVFWLAGEVRGRRSAIQ